MNSPREPRGLFSSFEKLSVKSHIEDLLENSKDKLLVELIFRTEEELASR